MAERANDQSLDRNLTGLRDDATTGRASFNNSNELKTTSMGANSPSIPTFTQDRGQAVNEEATITSAGADPFTGDLTLTLDKDTATSVSSPGPGAATLVYTFVAPTPISRVAVRGNVTGLTIAVVDVVGDTTTVLTPGVTDADGADSADFAPIMAVSVTLSYGAAITNTAIEVIIQKVEPAVSPAQVTAAVFSAVAIPAGASATRSDGVAFADPTDLAGLGVDVSKEGVDTITALIRLADPSASPIDADLDWYVSDDDSDYFYAGTTPLNDVATALNPTGFVVVAVGQDSWQAAPKPSFIFGRFVALVIRNNNATTFAATVRLARQR